MNTLALHLSSFYFILLYPLLTYRAVRYVTFYALPYVTLSLWNFIPPYLNPRFMLRYVKWLSFTWLNYESVISPYVNLSYGSLRYGTFRYTAAYFTLAFVTLRFLQYFTLRCLMLRHPGYRDSRYITLLFILSNYLFPHFLMLVYDKDGLSSLIRNIFYTPRSYIF